MSIKHKLILFCVGLKHIFNKALIILVVAGSNYTQNPSSGSLFGNGKHDYPQLFPLSLENNLCWVDWHWPRVCWPLTNREKSRGGIHYSVSPLITHWLQPNPPGLIPCRKPWKSHGFVSQRSSARDVPGFSKSILPLRLIWSYHKIVFNPVKHTSSILSFYGQPKLVR